MKPTTLHRTALIIALASVYPLSAYANAGTAQFSVGDVSLQRAASTAPLAGGGRVESGDLITTGNNGRTQLRFTDGGMVSLQPNSQFKISKYSDAGDGKQDSFLVDLARGGMRALTGLIGKRNRDNYKVTTTTATIGIRGSGFSMAYNPDGTLGVTTEQDAIEVCTKAGCVGLNLGESAMVTNSETLPTRIRERARWNPPEPRRLITARNDDTKANGSALNVAGTSSGASTGASTTLNTNLAYSGAGLNLVNVHDGRFYANGTGIFSGADFLGYEAQNGFMGSGGTATVLSSSGSYANGDLLVMGTWANSSWYDPITTAETLVNTAAFVTGQVTPVPQAGISTLFPSGASYTMSTSTPVFSSTGDTGYLNFASINITNFSTLDIDVYLQATFVNESYIMTGSNILTSTTFNVPLTVTPVSCSTGCNSTGNANGFFVGPNAERAGLSFTAVTSLYGKIGGAATLAPVPTSPD